MTWMTLTKNGRKESHKGIPTLADLQKAVGGYVEVFDLERRVSMWCNEEAKINSTLLGGTETRMELENVKATHLITNHGPGLFPNDYIGGDVAFTGQPDDNGETTGLTAEGIEMVRLA
jgi:hypothetical protein